MVSKRSSLGLSLATVVAVAGCSSSFDIGNTFGNSRTSTETVDTVTADRPQPDSRGIISYPGYQVAVAQRGDTVGNLAARIGIDAASLARFNGLQVGDTLREGEVVALPNRVAEPIGGPITPGSVDIAALAGSAIDEADANNTAGVTTTTLDPAPRNTQPDGVSGVEPVRHKVERGETAFTIARLYNVSVRSLADWNALDSDFSVREGQYLLIPVALPGSPRSALDPSVATLPGEGTETPEPPSASEPLPDEETAPASEQVETTAAPDLSGSETQSQSRMSMPVRGDIVRDYSKGSNEGIDIAAAPGTPVGAAATGTVAAITEDTNGSPIIVVKHANNILTVYSNVGNVVVSKGQSVSRGTKLAEIKSEGSAVMHFQVREGFESIDPNVYLSQ